MVRAALVVTLVAVLCGVASSQVLGVLHVKVTLTDAARGVIPISRHALLISDNPATSTPRRIVTAPDGTATIRLRAGNYTVESDEPVAFNGKGYQWTQTLDIAAGGDVVLELNANNAEVGSAPATSTSDASKENASSLLLPQWQDSVVAVWTPASRASGFLVQASGLVVTSQRVIGTAAAVEVQLSPSVKVAARVLVADRVRDVAVPCGSILRPPHRSVRFHWAARTGRGRRWPTGRGLWPSVRRSAGRKRCRWETWSASSRTRSWPTSGLRPAAPAARCSAPVAVSSDSRRSWTTRMTERAGTPASSPSMMCARLSDRRRRRCRPQSGPPPPLCPWSRCGRFPPTCSPRQ